MGEKKKTLLSQIFLSMSVFISDCFPLSLSVHFTTRSHSRSLSGLFLYSFTSGAYAPVFIFSLVLILITNSKLITSILNNSSEALDS